MAKLNFHLGVRLRSGSPRVESESAQFGRGARRDWRALCIAFLVLNAASVAFSFYLYRSINQGELFLVDRKEPVSSSAFDRRNLDEVVARLEERERKFNALKAAPLSGIPGPGPVITPKEKRTF